ncbi:hypothetical protein [Paludisphaera mucosa]|uniref:Uncharacterized protein n=1 Tax=Paludisphaera mucosa TaxID=3030827 RepID=A0ABT6FLP0_9BACT|nr:hypothetical protein [Paludisphaera mucosa]MDG3008490.1 hypothetical protein [Paludisphaera mucosa]
MERVIGDLTRHGDVCAKDVEMTIDWSAKHNPAWFVADAPLDTEAPCALVTAAGRKIILHVYGRETSPHGRFFAWATKEEGS